MQKDPYVNMHFPPGRQDPIRAWLVLRTDRAACFIYLMQTCLRACYCRLQLDQWISRPNMSVNISVLQICQHVYGHNASAEIPKMCLMYVCNSVTITQSDLQRVVTSLFYLVNVLVISSSPFVSICTSVRYFILDCDLYLKVYWSLHLRVFTPSVQF